MLIALDGAEQAAAKHLAIPQPSTTDQPLHRGAGECASGFRFERPGRPAPADILGQIIQQLAIDRTGLRLDLNTFAADNPLLHLVEEADHYVVVFIQSSGLLAQADRRLLGGHVGATPFPLGLMGSGRHCRLVGHQSQAVAHPVGCPAG
ncbi:hypothetical protein D3C78_1211800 [compost metagenome]